MQFGTICELLSCNGFEVIAKRQEARGCVVVNENEEFRAKFCPRVDISERKESVRLENNDNRLVVVKNETIRLGTMVRRM